MSTIAYVIVGAQGIGGGVEAGDVGVFLVHSFPTILDSLESMGYSEADIPESLRQSGDPVDPDTVVIESEQQLFAYFNARYTSGWTVYRNIRSFQDGDIRFQGVGEMGTLL